MLCRVWAIGLVGAVVLSLSNIFLTLHILSPKEDYTICRPEVTDSGTYPAASTQKMNLTSYWAFLRESNIISGYDQRTAAIYDAQTHTSFVIDNLGGRWDNSRRWKIFDKVYVGPNYKDLARQYPVCLATQSSVDRLFWLVQAARHWLGTISVTVFTPDIEYGIAKTYLQFLTSCFPYLGEKVTVHFTYPVDKRPVELKKNFSGVLNKCDEPVTFLKNLLKLRSKEMMSWREKMAYPQNLVRNVARKNCQSEWVFLVDVDIVSPPGLTDMLSAFLKTPSATSCAKCAYVIPTYEIDEHVPLPKNATEILKLVDQNKARPFHEKVFIHNQFSTNFTLWQKNVRKGGSKPFVSHDVRFEFFYEPFYVARDNCPPHDERFVGYGFTRNTQTYEMLSAGWQFKVLAPTYTIHWGMQTKKTRPRWREAQNSVNRKHFENFKKEVLAKYQNDPLGFLKAKRKVLTKSTKRKGK